MNRQIFGKQAISVGFLTDSMGLPIDPNGIYDTEGPDGGWTFLCRTGMRVKVRKPLTRRS